LRALVEVSRDLDHFDTLVAAHHGEIYTYLVLVTGRVSDADDLSQQTFLRAFKAGGSPAPVAGVRPWLFAIATDLCRTRLRSRSHRRRGREEDRDARFRQAQPPVALAITRLPVKQRMALALRKLHAFDYESIGQMLRCPTQSARAWVVQAFRKVGQMRSVLDSRSLRGERSSDMTLEPPPR
jgi:RNA polymerase sigma-70 factor (ECF subfamily)